MSFKNLNLEELKSVVTFFNKDLDLVVADEEHGPTKRELVAALATGDPEAEADGDKPVSWDDYKELYLPSREAAAVKNKNDDVPDLTSKEVKKEEVEEVDKSGWPLVKFTGQNPRYDMAGYTFSKAHPFHQVPAETQEYLVGTGLFRPATAKEVADFYN